MCWQVTSWELARLVTAQTQVEVVTHLAVNTRADDKCSTPVATVPVEVNNDIVYIEWDEILHMCTCVYTE